MLSFFAVLMFLVVLCNATEASQCPPKSPQRFPGKLQMDKAFLNITSNLLEPITIMGISSNCFLCPLQVLHKNVKTDAYILLPTDYEYVLEINTANTSRICSLTYLYGEYGWYEYKVQRDVNGQVTCKLDITKEPHNANIPILVAFVILVILAILWILFCRYEKKIIGLFKRKTPPTDNSREEGTKEATSEQVVLQSPGSVAKDPVEANNEQKRKKRLKSLDTFRGIAITVMIFVNAGGGGYYFFGHAVWNGLLLADLVFPWFIWIMGVSITLSFKSIRQKKIKSSVVLRKIIRRSIVLFLLGIFTSNFDDLEYYRIPGVLQRFAICYFVVALMQLYLPPENDVPKRWLEPFRDVFALWKQWVVMAVVLIIFLIVTYGVKVGDCPKGYTGPGGIGSGYPLAFNCTGGVANYIDRKFLGNHIYRWPTVKGLYQTKLPHDPEGCLGSLTSIILVFLGVQAGQILQTYPGHKSRILRWMVWGVLLGVLGLGLCGGTKNEIGVPINKNLWSVTFILVTGATSFVLLAICYILTDTLEWWSGAPFFYPGMNSILLYVGHGIIYNRFPFSWKMDEYATHAEKLAMNLISTALWVLISYHLFRKKFFLTV